MKLFQNEETDRRRAKMILSGRVSKVIYVVLLAVVSIIALAIRAETRDLDELFSFDDCADSAVNCISNQVIYRFSFILFLFFLTMALLSKFVAPVIHYDYWLSKLSFLVVSVVVLFFLIPAEFYKGYAEAARVLSAFFLLYQVLIFIDLAYNRHHNLLDGDGTGSDGRATGLFACNCAFLGNNQARRQQLYLGICVVLQLCSLIGIVLLYTYLGDCPVNVFLITLTMVMGYACTLISMHSSVMKGTLTPSIVYLYCVFQCWQIISSSPDEECNPMLSDSYGDNMLDFQTAVGSLILLAALMYAAYNVSHNGLDIFNGSDGTEDAGEGDSYARTHSSMPADEEADQKVAHNNHGDKDSSYGNGNGNNNSSDSSGRVFKVQVSFHVIMCLASCYMAMLFTNWTPSNGDSKDSDSSTSRESWWVQAIAQWITYLLYVWTLVAPLLFPDRDFSGRI